MAVELSRTVLGEVDGVLQHGGPGLEADLCSVPPPRPCSKDQEQRQPRWADISEGSVAFRTDGDGQ